MPAASHNLISPKNVPIQPISVICRNEAGGPSEFRFGGQWSNVEGRLRQANLRSTRRSPKRSQFPKRGGIPIGRGDADLFAAGWWRGVNDNRLDTCRRRTGKVKTNSLEKGRLR